MGTLARALINQIACWNLSLQRGCDVAELCSDITDVGSALGPFNHILCYYVMMPSLPSYLTSGASSRAHHAFLVKLHRCESEQEEVEVIEQELVRARSELAVKGGPSLVCLHAAHPYGLLDRRTVYGSLDGKAEHPGYHIR